jgi:hypothetical protein
MGDREDYSPTDAKKVIGYFNCLFGDKMTLVKVATHKSLKEHCEYNGYTKEFVLKTIKEYLSPYKFKE